MIESQRRYLSRWYATPRGEAFAAKLEEALTPWLEGIFGYHAIQLGHLPASISLLHASRINHKIVADELDDEQLRCQPEALPFAADSVDLVIVAHCLEYSSNPHAILREAERILVPEGRIVIIGIDPWTLWGAWQMIKRSPYPLYTQGRIRDWLAVLGLEYQRSQLLSMLNLRLPNSLAHSTKSAQLANLLSANIAGGYLMLAQKRVATITPIKPRWERRPRLTGGRLAEPAASASSNLSRRTSRGLELVRSD
jgi:SAM-dependent methyltransferase